MGQLKKEVFICLDCETTGLDTEKDEIIEVAATKFTFEGVIATTETLVKPKKPISPESTAIHHITDDMVKDSPSIKEVIPEFFDFVGNHIIMGHGILYDISILNSEAKRAHISRSLSTTNFIDTLRLARLYGGCAVNSLQKLREHFNIPAQGAHRAMNDVIVNIDVFKHLTKQFKTTEELVARLKKPIAMKAMPLGKHKGRQFSEIPLEYLRWASHQDFDQDLLYSLRSEIKKRKAGNHFTQASNPFSNL